ncbi:MAG: murein biosynthesis integral membrane protein MurJ [Firmicutes bacterium]|nr:murein biosynthesis integral membrane protein MurJ [Bacillota bacterium]
MPLNSSSREKNADGVIKWTALVVVFNILSRLLGFFREMSIAYRFGALAEADAYLVAIFIPSFLFVAFRDAVRNAFIPIYGDYKGKEEGASLVKTAFAAFSLFLLLLTIVGTLAAPLIVRLIAPGFEQELFSLSLVLTRIILPSIFFLGLAGLVTSVLHAHYSFLAPATIGIPYNLLIIFSALLLGALYGVRGLAWGTLLAFSSQFFIQLPAFWKLMPRGGKIHWRHPGLKAILKLMPPIILASGAFEFKIMVDRIFASFLPVGRIAVLSYASRLYNLPYNIIVLALITVFYPLLVDYYSSGDLDGYRQQLRRGLLLIQIFLLPMTVGLIVLREPIVSLVFERGAFEARDTSLTAVALAFYSLGLPFLGLRYFLERSFFALKDTRTPMLAALGMVGLNAVFNYLLIRPLSHGGIALGTSLSGAFAAFFLLYLLWRRLGHLGGKHLLSVTLRCLAAALLMGLALHLGLPFLAPYLAPGTITRFLVMGAVIAAAAAFYFFLLYLFRVREISWILDLFSRFLNKKRGTEGEDVS